MAAGETLLAIGPDEAKGSVFKSTVEESPDDLLSFFAFVGVDADAHKITGGFDDVFLAELTVLRCGVAGSKDARDAAALGGDGHEEDGLVGTLGFSKAVFENGIPGDAGGAEVGIGFSEVFGARSAATRAFATALLVISAGTSGTATGALATRGSLTAGWTFSTRWWSLATWGTMSGFTLGRRSTTRWGTGRAFFLGEGGSSKDNERGKNDSKDLFHDVETLADQN